MFDIIKGYEKRELLTQRGKKILRNSEIAIFRYNRYNCSLLVQITKSRNYKNHAYKFK